MLARNVGRARSGLGGRNYSTGDRMLAALAFDIRGLQIPGGRIPPVGRFDACDWTTQHSGAYRTSALDAAAIPAARLISEFQQFAIVPAGVRRRREYPSAARAIMLRVRRDGWPLRADGTLLVGTVLGTDQRTHVAQLASGAVSR